MKNKLGVTFTVRSLFRFSPRYLFLAILATVVLSGCSGGGGGGGGGDPPVNTATNSNSATVNTNTIVISDAQTAQIASTIANTDGSTQLVTTANSPLGTALTVGNVVLVAGGTDTRFPLGLAGKVTDVTTGSDGVTSATLTNATFAEVVQKSSFQAAAVELNSTNFIGVIAPKAVQASPTAQLRSASLFSQKQISALNGGLVFSEPSLLGRSILGGSGAIGVGEIQVALKVKLGDMEIEPSRFKPYGLSGDASIGVTGSIKNLKLIENHDFDTTAGVTTGLKSLDMRVTGDIDLAINLHGGAEVDLGYFSQAWDEVDDQLLKNLGISAKLTGMDSKDKIGKFPIAGLVFSAPCPLTGCPITIGQTQTPLRAAKAGGIILWIYVTANGKITLDGEIGARWNAAQLNIGLQKPENEKFDVVHELNHTQAGRFIEAPYLEGEVAATARLGPEVDVDFFTFGVRVANVSAFVGGQANLTVKTIAPVSWGTTNFGDPWTLEGQACLQHSIGAGAIISATANIGIELDTPLKKDFEGSFSYSGTWPTEEAILIPGGHGFFDVTWYTSKASNSCWPAPVVSKIVTTQDVPKNSVTIAISGTNLPDDLLLDVSPAENCTGLQKSATSDTEVSFSCQLAGTVTNLYYGLSTPKADNIDLSAIASQLSYTISPLNTVIDSKPPASTTATSATFTFHSAPSGGTFECKLDSGSYAVCSSPQNYTDLAVGSHTFLVRAINAAGSDPSPASSTWTITILATPPDTLIDSSPPGSTTATAATFAFHSEPSGGTFVCKLDSGSYATCSSPQSYSNLSFGSHTFLVQATDAAGTDPTPASMTWTINNPASPPDTLIDSSPPASTTSTGATFTFHSAPSGGTYECKLDGGSYATCSSPQDYSSLAVGSHTFVARAINAAGTDPSPASITWTINSPALLPDTLIDSSPPASTTSTAATFTFRSTPSGGTFECKLDSGSYASCSSPQSYSSLAVGSHTFLVRATNAAGTDASPASSSWSIGSSSSSQWIQSTGPGGGNVYSLAVDPATPGTLYAGISYSGVFKSTDGGGTWNEANAGLTITNSYAYALAVDPATPGTLYVGTEGGGVYKSTDGGATWNATGLQNSTVSTLTVDPATPGTLYAGASGSGVLKSTDGGANWSASSTGLPSQSIRPLVVDPATPGTLYAGTNGSGVFKSTDGGANWSAANTGLTDLSVSTIAVDPATPGTLYAGGFGGVFKSADGGATWNATSPTNSYVNTIAVDPATLGTLYASTHYGVFKSTDGGGTWNAANTGLTDLRVGTLAVDPATPGTLYAGTDSGVFKSTNGGASWNAINTGLNHLGVNSLVLDGASPPTLFAGTAGGSVYVNTNP